MKIIAYLLFLFGIISSAFAGDCSVELKRLLKEAKMIEKVFPDEYVHNEILKTATTIKNARLVNINIKDDSAVFPNWIFWRYKFQFVENGPILEISVDQYDFIITPLVTFNERFLFSIGDYIRHIENKEAAYKYTQQFQSGKITKNEMFDLEMKRLRELLKGELGEVLRGEKSIIVPNYTWNDYK